jgi:hypothetical protein
MAGDWLKICKETPTKPEILVIATKLNIHPDVAFARCFHLWAWFDSNTKDGITNGVTKVTIDALLHRDGLCDTLIAVGWLCENNDGNLYLPNFDRHNSETAKTRALGKKRQNKHRDKSNANSNANVTVEALPEKRREEKIKQNHSASDDAGIEYSKSFLSFWDMYPLRKNKGHAYKAFIKIKASEYPDVKAGLIAAKESQDWIKDNGKYIPHPATWLNARGWEDETHIKASTTIVCPTGYPFSEWMKLDNQKKAEVASQNK